MCTCAWCQQRSEGVRSSGTVMTGNCESPWGCWESSQNPMKEYKLLNAESCPSPCFCHYNKVCEGSLVLCGDRNQKYYVQTFFKISSAFTCIFHMWHKTIYPPWHREVNGSHTPALGQHRNILLTNHNSF